MAIVKLKHEDYWLEKTNSCHMKAALLQYFRFRKQRIACTEYDYRDIFVVHPKTKYITEVEVKISIADLKADFNKSHRIDLIMLEQGHKSKKVISSNRERTVKLKRDILDYIYYALPAPLIDKALPILDEMIPFAGVISVPMPRFYPCNGAYHYPDPVTVKRAKKIKNKNTKLEYTRMLERVALRMSSDITNFNLRSQSRIIF